MSVQKNSKKQPPLTSEPLELISTNVNNVYVAFQELN